MQNVSGRADLDGSDGARRGAITRSGGRMVR
jgi:hypothetical protein